MNQTQNSNFVDPFEDQSILSLHPRTFGGFKDALKSKDLASVHQHMKSMALQSPDKHFEEAKSVVDGGSEFLKTMEIEANKKEKENLQGHRPGLARRRAKFSLKPDISQSSTVLEPTLEINHLQGPEEFFAAFEKFENTKKELKRQRGGEDVDEVKTSTTARVRRPEIPRRKVSYKHHEYSSQSQDDIFVSQDKIESQLTQSSQKESLTSNQQHEEEEELGSITKSQKKVNSLFDELMASNINELDGNQALSFLKDRMKIKPVEIDDLHLPEFHRNPTVDFLSPVKNLLEDSHTILSTSNTRPNVTKGNTQKKLPYNPLQSLGSPTPPRSPFLAISNFGKNMLKSFVSKDPFSSHDVDFSPPKTSNKIIGESSHASKDASKDKEFPVSATLDSLVKEKITENAIGDVEERNVLDDNVVSDIQTIEEINGNGEDMVQKEASVTEVDMNIEENVEDVREKEGSVTLEEVNVETFEMEDLSQPGVKSNEGLDTVIPAQDPDIVPEQQIEEQAMTRTNKTKKKSPNKKKKTTPQKADPKTRRQIFAAEIESNSVEDIDTSIPTQNLDMIPELQNEEHRRTRVDKRKKTDLKKKRQSLAGAGSCWESGVRKSSRLTRRPLEYWKGERLLYGRVHNSLPTIIGVKYISPSKSGFKVESFVSEKYKDLVEWTAMH